jgi:hypothetical protein
MQTKPKRTILRKITVSAVLAATARLESERKLRQGRLNRQLEAIGGGYANDPYHAFPSGNRPRERHY